jgi:hypothetical protein
MHEFCVMTVDGLCEICVKFRAFYPVLILNISVVEKLRVFTTSYARLLRVFFHPKNLVFQSVRCQFLPIINKTNNNDNYIKLTFNYWRTYK